MKNISSLVKLVRPTQWVKNVFVGVTIFLTPTAMTMENLITVLGGFACFCAMASSIYILNDYLDRKSDILHPQKRNRPLANGAISPKAAGLLAAGILIIGLTYAYFISSTFFLWGLSYVVLMILYSIFLKHYPPVDVLVIAFGFVIRVEAGASMINVTPTVWLLILTMLLALFLALAKRRDDLTLNLDEDHRPSLAGYNKPFLDISISLVLGSLLVSYIIYTNDTTVMGRVGTNQLYLTIPFVVLGVLRYLQILLVFKRPSSPENVLTTDKLMTGTVVCWLVLVCILLYS